MSLSLHANVREIGSEFRISPSSFFAPVRNRSNAEGVYLSTGRDCLEYILKKIPLDQTTTVLLPSFLCDSIITPFKNHQIPIRFYLVREDLSIDMNDFRTKISGVTAVVIIHYFGFIHPHMKKIRALCHKERVLLIEDLVHSFLSAYTPRGDFWFTSYRKILPLPNGAFLYQKYPSRGSHVRKRFSFTHLRYVWQRFIASLIRDISILKPLRLSLFSHAEHTLVDAYPRPAPMSLVSRHLLSRMDLSVIRRRRRENYLFLLRTLRTIPGVVPLFPSLDSSVCPSGFPIRIPKRDMMRELLIQHKIYPPIHWTIPPDVPSKTFRESYRLSREVLTIPIDQRYTLSDMKRVVEVLRAHTSI